MIPFIKCLVFCLLCLSTRSEAATTTTSDTDKKESFQEEVVETSHSVKINGVEVPYKAIAGTIVLKDEQNNPKAKLFYVSYSRSDIPESGKRPITFCFNGGPGASAVWLQLGALGPRRVVLAENGYGDPPYGLQDNEFSLLDVTDLVFIDPVSTGYSREAPGEDPKQFHGYEEDIKSVGEFIRLYTTKYGRWDSPKFLAGESYGTLRAVGLAEYLYDQTFYYVNGIILVSSLLHYQTIDFSPGNDLPYPLFLPSYTAAAWYHGKLSKDLQAKSLSDVLEEVEKFALEDYALALMKGDSIQEDQRKKIGDRLAYYTSLSPAFIQQNNLRVDEFHFMKELLKDQNRVLGRFDSRVKGITMDTCSWNFDYDPSMENVLGLFTATFYQYAQKELGWKKDDNYKVLSNVWPWNYGTKANNQYLYVGESIKKVMTKNPNTKVFIASGYYDLATPYFGTEYTFTHLGLDPSLKKNISPYYYDAGHMMFTDRTSLAKLKKDLSTWMIQSVPQS